MFCVACALLLAPLLQERAPCPPDVLDVGVALTMDQRRVIHNARLILREGKIAAVGRRSELPLPKEVGHHWVYPDSFAFPGGVELHSHAQTGGWGDINDMVNPDNPELRVLDTVVPWNPLYRDANAAGVTTVDAIPGSGTNLSGAGVLLKLHPGRIVEDVLLRQPGVIKVAQGYNPERGADLGGTRMGMWWMLRWWLQRTRSALAEAPLGAPVDPALEQIAGAFRGRHPILVHTAGARDSYGTVRMFLLEAGLPLIVSHASFHGYLAAGAIAASGASLNLGPRNFDFSFNASARFVGLVQAYEAAGNHDLSVQTDAPVVPLEEFFFQATLAERLGCSTWEALESINVDPARQVLVADRVGRLLPGLDADVVVKAGQPLDPRSPVQLVLVDGQVTYDIRDGQRY